MFIVHFRNPDGIVIMIHFDEDPVNPPLLREWAMIDADVW